MDFKNQADLFNHIWDTRPHVSELSGEPLLPPNAMKWIWQFLHVLPKGSYPKYKLREENIILALPAEHANQEQYEKFIERRDQLKREYYKEFYNKIFE
jgi:hypothetical protein